MTLEVQPHRPFICLICPASPPTCPNYEQIVYHHSHPDVVPSQIHLVQCFAQILPLMILAYHPHCLPGLIL